ncbi:tRNA isopentenyl-2-thiomethyl-A-37 hydroxylase MiaE [Shewanella sp. MF05960]|uniref:tRNA isopentenyl-2-thiomethyl-A-37 hydroxylase MiaE n=1 Tax=Shewanella sp. MF05960 TaxID=3434874 RepID=UPI003D7BFCEA
MTNQQLLEPIYAFLKCSTPEAWIEEAKKPENLSILLRDHLICELKAAQSAALLLKRYVLDDDGAGQVAKLIDPYNQYAYKLVGSLDTLKAKNTLSINLEPRPDCKFGQDMIDKMVLLIREELHHFYQVLEIIEDNQFTYETIAASSYARVMIKHIRNHEPETLIDKLIVGAFIEARSCERFAKIAPNLPPKIGKFYISLLRSEARHFQDYLDLAEQIAGKKIDERIAFFAEIEADFIQSPDFDFKFHSGSPIFI